MSCSVRKSLLDGKIYSDRGTSKNRSQLRLAPKLTAAHVEPPSFQLAFRAVVLANMLKLLVLVLQKVRMLFAVSELIPSLRRAGDDNARPGYINWSWFW